MNFPLKAVLFDFDGLLFNSEPIWNAAYQAFLSKNNVVDKPEVRVKMLGRGLFGVIKIMQDELGIPGDPKLLVNDYRQTFYKLFMSKPDILMPGALELVKKAKYKNLKTAVTTGGHSTFIAGAFLKRVGLFSDFDLVVSSDDVASGKPEPDVYLFTIKQLGVSGASCLALEDSPNGVSAARAAGIKVFGVNTNGEIRKELTAVGAERVFISLREIDI